MSDPSSPTSAASGAWHHPYSFYCPISQQCMHDPIILVDGHTYERRHIERWLQEHSTSPVSGLPLKTADIIPNHALRNAIEEYFQQIFSVHRRAIRKTIDFDGSNGFGFEEHSLGTNDALIRTIDGLMQCSLLVNADLDTESVLRQIMEEAKALLGAEAASVFLVDADDQSLYSRVNSSGSVLRIPITAGIAGHVASTGTAVIVPDAYSDSRFSRAMDERTGFRTRNIMCVPLKSKKDGIIGVVQLVNKTASGALSRGRARANTGVTSERKSSDFTADVIASAVQLSDACAEDRTTGGDFTGDDLQFLQVFASQAATAITASTGVASAMESRSLPEQQAASSSSEDCTEDEGPKGAGSFLADASIAEPLKQHSDSKVAELLHEAADGWYVDALQLDACTGCKPLSTLGVHLFEQLGLVKHFDLDAKCLAHFFAEIERGYDSAVPYHNAAHAASVMHGMYAVLEHGGLAASIAPACGKDDKLLMMACLLAAAVHDYGHLGLSNDFLVRTLHERALRYNDEHVNEHHHAAAALAVLGRPECNFLACLPAEEFRWVRKLVIKLVIGTDMADHGSILKAIGELTAGTVGNGAADCGVLPKTEKDAMLVLQAAMKCADLGHLALGWEDHAQWVHRLEEEFFHQGDLEKEAGLQPISFLMDRDQPGVSKTQVGFFDHMVLPFFRSFVAAVPAAGPLLQGVVANQQRWKALEPGAVTEVDEAAGQMLVSRTVSLESSYSTESSREGARLRKSGRARQRAAKYWKSIRCRTPSPEIWDRTGR